MVVLTLTQPKTEGEGEETQAEETTVDESLVFADTTTDKIDSIHVKNSLDDYTLVRADGENGASVWSIKGENIKQSLYNSYLFDSLAGYGAKLTAKELVEENASDLGKYGLDNPVADVEIKYTDGSSLSLIFGGDAPSGAYTYFAEQGSRDVYICYTYQVNSFFKYSRMNFIATTVMGEYDTQAAPIIKKITVKRKDLEEDIVVEALPPLPEESDSISVYSHTFTSPYNVYLDLMKGSEYIYQMYGLTATVAAYLENTEETKAKTGLDDPFCEVSMLVEDTVYRLYIGDAITETYTDETSGVTTTAITGYYGYCNQVPDVIYVFAPESVPWVTMDAKDYISKIFLMPYIYDLREVSYDDGETSFSVTITGNNEESHFYYADGAEVDGDRFRKMYQYMVQARGEELYTDEEKGELIATYIYKYEDETRPDSVVRYYTSPDGRGAVVNVDGINVYKTQSMYVTRLKENAAAFLAGEDIVLNY